MCDIKFSKDARSVRFVYLLTIHYQRQQHSKATITDGKCPNKLNRQTVVIVVIVVIDITMRRCEIWGARHITKLQGRGR